MHIVAMNTADLQRADPHILTDTMVLVNDIITNFQLSITLDPFSIIYPFGDLPCLPLLLREHLSFSDNG
ncbi:hypothetical protein D3C71_1211150 [compost metagenome]